MKKIFIQIVGFILFLFLFLTGFWCLLLLTIVIFYWLISFISNQIKNIF